MFQRATWYTKILGYVMNYHKMCNVIFRVAYLYVIFHGVGTLININKKNKKYLNVWKAIYIVMKLCISISYYLNYLHRRQLFHSGSLIKTCIKLTKGEGFQYQVSNIKLTSNPIQNRRSHMKQRLFVLMNSQMRR